jgi:hypothetical protein
MIVPTYIEAKDLSQRIARDANLGAYWPDGTRREFWIRARGRILAGEEKLDSLGVVNGELIHVLPQPPANSGVIERPPVLPEKETGSLRSRVRMVRAILGLLALTIIWSVALSAGAAFHVVLIPSVAVALMAVTAARHFWGPPGSAIRIPLVGIAVYLLMMLVAFLPVFISGESLVYSLLMLLLAFFAGVSGVFMGWLAWYGAVEPLPEARIQQMAQQLQEVREAPCALCQQPVDLGDPAIRLDRHCCGQVFHSGCYKARAAVTREGTCAFCGYSENGA